MGFGYGVGGSGKHGLHIDATNHIYSTGEFIFGSTGSNGQFISASNGNIEISSSNFHLQPDGDVTMAGTITAEDGTIGGFKIESNDLHALMSSDVSVYLTTSGSVSSSIANRWFSPDTSGHYATDVQSSGIVIKNTTDEDQAPNRLQEDGTQFWLVDGQGDIFLNMGEPFDGQTGEGGIRYSAARNPKERFRISAGEFFLGGPESHLSSSRGILSFHSTGSVFFSGSNNAVTLKTDDFYFGGGGGEYYISGSTASELEIKASSVIGDPLARLGNTYVTGFVDASSYIDAHTYVIAGNGSEDTPAFQIGSDADGFFHSGNAATARLGVNLVEGNVLRYQWYNGNFIAAGTVSGSSVTSTGNISGSLISTGSFGHIMKSGVNWDTAVSSSAAEAGFGTGGGGGGGISFDGSTANGVLTYKDSDEATVESSLTYDGTTLIGGIHQAVTGTEAAPAFQFASANDGFYHLASGDTGINVIVNDVQEFLFKDGGDFHADGDVFAYSTTTDSDKRLKTNIINISSSLDKVKKLRPVEFDWLVDRDKHEYGLIAQEVEEVVPMLVSEHNALGDTKKFLKELDGTDKNKTVDYTKLTVLLVDSIKEQQEQIEELKKEVEELKNGSS